MLKRLLKINLKVIGSICCGLLLAQIISAYFFGVIAEKQFAMQFRQLTNTPMVNVLGHQYKRGWFSSVETVSLSVNHQVLKNIVSLLPGLEKESAQKMINGQYEISYRTQITHGIFAGLFHGTFMPTLAFASTRLKFPEKLDKVLGKFFAGDEPLDIANILYFNKAGYYLLDSPAFNYDEALSGVKVEWGGLKAKIFYNTAFNKFQNSLVIPRFMLDAPTKGKFSLRGLAYAASSSYSPNKIKIGTTTLTLESIIVALSESTNGQFRLGEAVHMITGINSASFLNGIDTIDPTNFNISEVSYSAQSAEESNLFSASAVAKFKQLSSKKHNYGPMNFNFKLEHIDAPGFSRLIDDLELLSTEDQANSSNREKTISMLKTDMAPILVHQPKLSLSDFTLRTPSGIITLSGMATTRGFVDADMNDQNKFMQHLQLTLDISVPKQILAYFFLLQMKYFLTAGNAQMDQQSSAALAKVVNILLDNQMQVWLKKGYLTESNNLLHSKISMESGVVLLSNIPIK